MCSRTGDIVEPMMKEQWFLRCDEINDAILDAVNTAKVSSYHLLVAVGCVNC